MVGNAATGVAHATQAIGFKTGVLSIARHTCISNGLQSTQTLFLESSGSAIVVFTLVVVTGEFPNRASAITVDVAQHPCTLLHGLVLTSNTAELIAHLDHDFIEDVISDDFSTKLHRAGLRTKTHVVHTGDLLNAKAGCTGSLGKLTHTGQSLL